MTPVRRTDTARADLRSIHRTIALDSRTYARTMVGRIKRGVGRLRQFPQSGWRVEDWNRDDLREIVVGNYRVIYRLQKDAVLILTIIHGARRLPDPGRLES